MKRSAMKKKKKRSHAKAARQERLLERTRKVVSQRQSKEARVEKVMGPKAEKVKPEKERAMEIMKERTEEKQKERMKEKQKERLKEKERREEKKATALRRMLVPKVAKLQRKMMLIRLKKVVRLEKALWRRAQKEKERREEKMEIKQRKE